MSKMLKKVFAVVAVLCFIAAVAYAAAPDSIVLKASNGDVTFNHKKHSTIPNVACKNCHHTMTGATVDKKCSECHKAAAEGKTPSMKDASHKTCKDCHKKMGKGPAVKCTDCHVKAK